MMEKIARKMRAEEEGFTLIELMVVVLIIGILIAIALPTFLGARHRAQDRVSQSALRNELSTAKVLFTDNDNYLTADAAGLLAAEPSIKAVDSPALATDSAGAVPRQVSVWHGTAAAGTAAQWGSAALSDSGTCFYIFDDANAAPTLFGDNIASGDTCDGANAKVDATKSTGF